MLARELLTSVGLALLVGVSFLVVPAGAETGTPTIAGSPITVRVSCIEIDLARLRALGVAWDTSRKAIDEAAKKRPDELRGLVHGLAEGGFAKVKFEPVLAVTSGREGAIEINGSKVTTKATIISSEQIEVEARITVLTAFPSAHPGLPPSYRQMVADYKVLARPGETICLPRPGNLSFTGAKPEEAVALIFLVVDQAPTLPVPKDLGEVRYAEAPKGVQRSSR